MSAERTAAAASAATLAAATVPVLAVTAYAILQSGFWLEEIPSIIGIWAIVLVIAALHLLLAMPLYLLLRRHGWVNWGTSILGGLFVGAIPVPALFHLPGEGTALLIAFTGGAGLVGGLVFRWVLGLPEEEIA